jgi:hypothetical protein
MSAIRILRRSIVLGIAVGFVVAAAGAAEGQIFRRPGGRTAQPSPDAQPPRGLFPGLRRNPDPASSEGAVPRTTFRGGANPGSAIPGGAAPPSSSAPQEEIFIVVPLDEKPFQIEPTDYVRLTAGGMPGCEFSTKIEGPARVHRKIFVAGATEGKYAVGTDETEYEFAMTGLGKVKIDLIVTVPNGAAPTVMTYQFEVVPPKQ